jgi:hypothetical protein
MTRATYTGEGVPRFVPVCCAEGWHDSKRPATRHEQNLYRSFGWKRIGWRIGFTLGKVL